MDGFTEAVEAMVSKGDDATASASAPPPSAPADSGSTAPGSAAPPTASDPAPSVPASGAPPPATPPATAKPGPAGSKPAAAAAPPSTATTTWPKEATAALKEARDQNKTLREQYGWLPKEHASAFRGFYEAWRQDPIAALQTQLTELLKHPSLGPRLRSLMGVDESGQPDREPGPDLRNADTGEPAYSPQQMQRWQAWQQRQAKAGLDERLGPLEQQLAQQRERDERARLEAEAAELKASAAREASQLLAGLRQDPLFVQHEAAIRERYRTLVAEMPGKVAIYRAFADVLRGTVVPAATSAGREDLAASLSAKARATSLRPARAGAAPGPAKPPVDFEESAERLWGAR